MISKAALLDSIRHEFRVIQHLATQVPDGALDWRPTPAQRSTIELLRYMTVMAIMPGRAAVSGNWDHAAEMNAEAETVTAEGFADAMNRQLARLEELFDGIDEGTAGTTATTSPWGTPTTVAASTIDMILKPLVAYRMQLFLYAKQSGNAELGPADCWAGVSMPAPGL